MKSLKLMTVLAALAGLPCAFARRMQYGPELCGANISEGTHERLTRKADAALTAKNLLVKEGTDSNHSAINGAADKPIGPCTDEAAAAEDLVNVIPLGAVPHTVLMVASEAIAANADVYTAASGKIQDEPAVAGTYYMVGRARKAAAANNDVIEVQPCAPVKVVVIAALTSTNGTAGAAADLAALKAEAENIGDDVRAIAAALATPALIKVLA